MGWGGVGGQRTGQHYDGAGSTWKWAQRPGVKSRVEATAPNDCACGCSCHNKFWGPHRRPRKEQFFYFPPIFSPFPFSRLPHHLRYSFQNYSDPSRHICHTPSIITCPFSAYPYIIPNRTSVQARPSRPVLCTSLLLSWRVTSRDCPTLSFSPATPDG